MSVLNTTPDPHFGRFGRRAFLGKAGGLIALPLLPSLFANDSTTSNGQTIKPRMVFLYTPNGIIDHYWVTDNKDYLTSSTLSPLAKWRDRVTILSGITGKDSPWVGEFSAHTNEANILSQGDWDVTKRTWGVTMDQIAAQHLQGQAPFSSLQFTGVSPIDTYWSSFPRSMAYDQHGRVLPSMASPEMAMRMLFDASAVQHQASILDHVVEQTRAVSGQLSLADQRRLDAYLQSIRDVETRIAATKQLQERQPPLPDSVTRQYEWTQQKNKRAGFEPEYFQAMMDVLVIALQVDASRVITFLSHYGTSEWTFPQIDVRSHHAISHHGNKEENLSQLKILDKYLCETLAKYLIQRLAETPDGEHDLLSSTMVVYGSGVSGGRDVHGTSDLKFVLAGGEKCGIKQGQQFDFKAERGDQPPTKLSNLFLTLHHALGVPTTQFANSDGDLDHLLLNA